jgi:hypothetical protein
MNGVVTKEMLGGVAPELSVVRGLTSREEARVPRRGEE